MTFYVTAQFIELRQELYDRQLETTQLVEVFSKRMETTKLFPLFCGYGTNSL